MGAPTKRSTEAGATRRTNTKGERGETNTHAQRSHCIATDREHGRTRKHDQTPKRTIAKRIDARIEESEANCNH